jgi:hypothetical protein
MSCRSRLAGDPDRGEGAAPTMRRSHNPLVPKLRLGNGSSGLGTAPWESKLELLHSCVPKLELGNKKIEANAFAIHNPQST